MISVIIPTLNEAGRLGALLASLQGQRADCEIIVADGGSVDGTRDVARRFGATVVSGRAGRGRQLARGAEAAAGEILLFLHADSIFPRSGLDRITRALGADSDYVGGNFRVLFDGPGIFARRLTRFYAWIRTKGLYYGDSAIFVRRRVYRDMGGVLPIALMEDYEFSRRLERAGPTLCIQDPPVITSSRKFEGRGAPAIVSGWLLIHLLYHLGVSPDRLARIYYRSARQHGRIRAAAE